MNLNKYLMSQRDTADEDVISDYSYPIAKRIVCNDGFSLSVQATRAAYCLPRTNIATWSHVEVGYPSAEPTSILSYAEDIDRPTNTVYGYVPIELVEALILEHGGAVSVQP